MYFARGLNSNIWEREGKVYNSKIFLYLALDFDCFISFKLGIRGYSLLRWQRGTERARKSLGRVPDFISSHNCGKRTRRCQTTGNYQKNLSAQSAAIFIVLWQIYTQSGAPGLAWSPGLTNCQGRGVVICLRWGFLHSLLKTCGFAFPLSPQEMAGQWDAK